ncbi:BrxA family protein [Oribacterium sp. Sow4_G1_1]|uniref:BrxA family protein n=1 Tax=Oribacterium sp. Sow4_G1_1 TaxID=3438794 RepID=UPI003F9A3DC9
MGELKYKASLTREQFLFYETRTVARLMLQGKSEIEIVEEVVRDNLFQYPTERTIKHNASACYLRLALLGDRSLIEAIAHRGRVYR